MYTIHVNTSEIFSFNLTRFRKRKGLSLRQLAALTHISYRMIYHYEQNPVSIPFHALKTLADTLNVSIADFFNESERNQDINDIDVRWIKKIRKIQELPEADIKEINHHINSTIEKADLRRKVQSVEN